LAYRWTFQDNVVEYGEVQKLSQACGIEFQTLKKIGLVDQKGSKINLFNALERPKTKINDLSFVNIMHGLLIAWKEGNSDELDTISSLFDKVSNTAFWKYCQAVAECHSIKNPEKQLLEGILTSKYSR
jgi:hypothetical protein